MGKICFTTFLLILFLDLYSQRNYSVTAASNFSFLANRIANNDAGIGISIAANAFSHKQLQLKADASLDYFFGDKTLFIDAFGKDYPTSPTMLNFRVGPEFFRNKISITALYGYVSYKLTNYKVRSGNIKLALNSHLGKQKKTLAGVYFTQFTGKCSYVHFWGLNIGYRIL